MRKTLLTLGVAAIALGAALTAQAFHNPQQYSLFGDATYISPGNASNRAVYLVSDSSPGYGGIDYGVEEGTTFAELTTLGTDFRVEADDTCIGGSPRFQINLLDPVTGDEGNAWTYFGPESLGAPCIPGTWQNTGDFLQTGRTLDTTQLNGGAYQDPYDTALTKYGGYVVTGIQVVVDAGWHPTQGGEQAADIDNTLINSTLFTYEVPQPTNKEQCKNGGWQNLARANGTTFKNQGDCIQYANTGK